MATAPTPREDFVYMAKLAEQAERYEEMVELMEKVTASVESEELTVEERNLLPVAYKCDRSTTRFMENHLLHREDGRRQRQR
ncbi:hypothetical protein RYX36_026733 [Vicia faba]